MNKSEKEMAVIGSWIEFFKIRDKDLSVRFYKVLSMVGGVIAFPFYIGLWNVNDVNVLSIILYVAIAVFIANHANNQCIKHFNDAYKDFIESINEGKVLSFSPRKRNWYEMYINYKEKHAPY
jgi:hypothetical protein